MGYNGILFSSEKEQTTDTSNSMEEAQMPLRSVKVADTEATHCTIPVIFQFGKGNTVRTGNTSVTLRGWDGRRS